MELPVIITQHKEQNPGIFRIALIGLPGSGKSIQGQRLAEVLSLPLLDTDTLFEQESGRQIKEVFSSGEEVLFRAWEKQWLHHLEQLPSCVVSTGGGLPCLVGAMQKLNQYCLTIWLKVNHNLIWQRLQKNSHPLLYQYNFDSFQKLVTLRIFYYQQAQIHLDATGSIEQVQQRLQQLFMKR